MIAKLSSTCILFCLFFAFAGKVQCQSRTPGVPPGNWFIYDSKAFWNSTNSNAKPPTGLLTYNETQWIRLVVTEGVGAEVHGITTWHFNNGSEENYTGYTNVETGSTSGSDWARGPSIIAATGLGANDTLYLSSDSLIINETITRVFPDGERAINHIVSNLTDYANRFVSAFLDLYLDQKTGVTVDMYYEDCLLETPNDRSSLRLTLIETSVWTISEPMVGAKIGDWIKYRYVENISGPLPPGLHDPFLDTDWINLTLLDISGSMVSFGGLQRFKNGTEQSTLFSGDITYGGPMGGQWGLPWLTAANLDSGDVVYQSPYWRILAVNDTLVREYISSSWVTNHANVTSFETLYGGNLTSETNYYWDRRTGFMLETSIRARFENETTNLSYSFGFEIIETNIVVHALIVDPFYSDWSFERDLVYKVKDYLQSAGYSVSIMRDMEVTVESLRNSLRCGVVLWRGHTVGPTPLGLITGEIVTYDNSLKCKEDIDNNRIGHVYKGSKDYWAIRPEFLEYYYASQMLPSSLIVVEGCASLSNPSLASAFVGVGAETYVGYTMEVVEPLTSYDMRTLFKNLCEKGYTVQAAVDSVFWGKSTLQCYGNPDLRLTSPANTTPSIGFAVHSPVDLYVTDPENRHIGFDATTNQLVNEIDPDAICTGTETTPQVIWIPDALNGTYQVQLVGTSDGSYNLTVAISSPSMTKTESQSGPITANQAILFIVTVAGTDISIIPEFPSFLVLPLFMITTLLSVIFYRRKHTSKLA